MIGMTVDKEKCVGCGLCVKSCPQDVITLQGKKAMIGEGCVACGFCRDACRFGAIVRGEEEPQGAQGASCGILVVAEQHQGDLLDITLELLCKANQLKSDLECPSMAVLAGENMEKQAQLLIEHGADTVYLCDSPAFAQPMEGRWADLVQQVIGQCQPEIVLFGATEFGRSLAPRVAARLQTGLTADCTVLEIDREKRLLQQTRPAFGGNLMATIVCPARRPQMATVRPGVFQRGEPQKRQGAVRRISAPDGDYGVELLASHGAAHSASIADTQVIVAVGKGIGNQKNIRFARELARLLGGQVGASRPLVDAGWAEYPMQVGQTGRTVAPKLYIACGISGAIQHLAGMSNAETIVAINTDPGAPIFNVAHYAVVGDCVEVLKQMIASIKAAQ